MERNRLRRRLREIVRRRWLPGALEEGRDLDVVIRARPEAYRSDFDELGRDLVRALGAIPWDGSSSG